MKVEFVCVSCEQLLRVDVPPEKNDTEEICPRCGVKDVPWIVYATSGESI